MTITTAFKEGRQTAFSRDSAGNFMEMMAADPGTFDMTNGFSGFRFPLGLGLAITGGFADADTVAVAAGQVKIALTEVE